MYNLKDAILNSKDYLSFAESFKSGEAKHAYIVVSPDQVLREAFVNEVSCLILNNREMVVAESHPDLIKVNGNDKGNIIVEDILTAIDRIQYKASLSQYKVVVINAKNFLSERVQNKLLKTLEEPPKDTIIFIVLSNLMGVLPTILSRTETLALKNLSTESLEKLGFEQEVIKKSENMLYLCNKLSHDKNKFELVENCLINMKKSSEVIEYSRKFAKTKEDCSEYLFYFGHIFNLLIKDNFASKNKIYSSSLVSEFPLMVISECIVALNTAEREVNANCALGQVMDKFLLKILEVKYLCKNNI